VDLLLLCARTDWSAGDLAGTEKLLQRALAADPSRLQAYALMGQLYAKQNRLDEAITRFEQVLKQSPKSHWAITMIGMLHEAQGKKPEAEKEYERALAIDPRGAVPANNLAWLYVEGNRNLDQALQLAQTAQQSLPQEPGVTDTLGWIYVRKNMASLGIPHLEASIRRSPSEPVFHYHLGMAYLQVNEFDKARHELNTALSLKPNFEGAADARKALSSIKG
jgi:Flp pilus assembly protein TadD